MFWSKKPLVSDEFVELIGKIKPLQTEIEVMKNKMDALETNVRSVRGLINRKLSKNDDEEDAEVPSGGRKGGVYLSQEEVDALKDQMQAMGYQPKS